MPTFEFKSYSYLAAWTVRAPRCEPQEVTYEETSFYIPQWKNRLVFDNDEQPFYVHTDPTTDAKQNVSLTYIFIYDFERIPREIEQFKDKEISEVKWMEISEVFQDGKEWAFHHDVRIEMAVEKFQKYLI